MAFVVTLSLLLTCTSAFVFDGSTNQSSGATDTQYLHLLLADEKQQRMQLQQTVQTMQGQMQAILDRVSELEEVESQCYTTCPARQESVAFMAQLSTSLSNPASGVVILFDDVITNEGRWYSPVNGTFVAPVNGTYHFDLIATSPPTDSKHQLHLNIVKNGVQIGYVFLDHSTAYWLRRTTATTVHLQQGDRVWVQTAYVLSTHVLAGCCFHTHFGGFLIQAD